MENRRRYVPISLEADLANISDNIGKELIFDVRASHKTPSPAPAGRWEAFSTNFFVVSFWSFGSPELHVLVSRSITPADSAKVQNAIVENPKRFRIDLTSVIHTVLDSEQGGVSSRDVPFHRLRRRHCSREHHLERRYNFSRKHSAPHP